MVGYLVKNVMNLIQIVSVKERIIMSDIFDSRDLLDELKTLDKEYDEEGLSESGEYLLAAIKKWLKDNVMEVQWEAERTRLWTPWTKN